jgi:predicted RNA binding protein YcfA (HicA-like mRNA interferase family)
MKALSGKEFIKLLEHHGWRLLRIHGSHHIYGKEGNNVRISVPVHGHQPLKIGLLKHLLKFAEISEGNFS